MSVRTRRSRRRLKRHDRQQKWGHLLGRQIGKQKWRNGKYRNIKGDIER